MSEKISADNADSPSRSDFKTITGEELSADATKRALHTKAPDTETKLDDVISALGGSASVTTPLEINKIYAVANAIVSEALPASTKKIMLRHRSIGKIEFSFSSGLPTFITIPGGANYKEEDVTLTGKTLYMRSPVTGVFELLIWT